ncbi:MAG TPA: maleylpyruvate isomerase family mycothiol-dependent enzyme [Candidatus Saccharimonadales bacterium]|jgi:uncharacterized protein (TIGR03083 family)|nr:maleylpyruvate isomerase family mycothiol-dependent enzyme [Candidatus Saccharimonadales bacterium]
MRPVQPIFTVHLFLPLHERLMELLRGLSPEDWRKPTVCRDWSVQDIVAHMLDTQVRILSRGRDAAPLPASAGPITSYSGLVEFLNHLNAQWVEATRRISPRLLMEFLALVGPQLAAYFASLDPQGPALFGVAWAGEEVSANWFDIGRNYTEYWHHQEQIRNAVGAAGLTGREWLHPVLALFMRALPHTYRDLRAPAGTAITVTITGEAGGTWSLVLGAKGWQLEEGTAISAVTQITLSGDTAWRLFTKGLHPEQARTLVSVQGDPALGGPFLTALAVMA